MSEKSVSARAASGGRQMVWNTACVFIMGIVFFAIAAPTNTVVRKKLKFDYQWRFFKGTPTGTPYQKAFNDASWTPVNIPHSCSYDKPWEEPAFADTNETGYYKGIAWYRKSFPALPAGGRTFVEFEGAMQSATVWLNETQIGSHDISGYTGFCFDMTTALATTGTNVMAVSLDNTPSADIPPGTNSIDYTLYSGMYRDVWLVTTGDVYIPYCGQLIDPVTVSAASGTFRARTKVTNSRAAATSCLVTIYVKDSTGADLCTVNATKSIPAGSTALFDLTSPVISNPKLWSPEHPYLYRIYTTVTADGKMTDDYVQTHGLSFMAWSVASGFSLNGARYPLKGTCYHQSMAWLENALPTSRYYKEVELIKAMGCNAIRCSHYPRDPDFYDACDKLGMLLLVEVPTWGGRSYSTAFFTRLYQSGREMVEQGYNHPCVLAWGAFNEPLADLSVQIGALKDTIHSIDPYRKVYVARQPSNTPDAVCNAVDVVGLNYANTRSNPNWMCVETEYDLDVVQRGATGEAAFATNRWNDWQQLVALGDWMAGGFMWVFADYTGKNVRRLFGAVDMMRVPKNAYYLFRQNWTTVANDDPVTGTSTRVELTADLSTLDADGCDVSLLTAALRNAAGACISDAKDVTFTVTGPATIFGAATKTTVAGKIAALLKSTTVSGPITVVASCTGLASDTVRLVSNPIIDPVGVAARQGRSFPSMSVGSAKQLAPLVQFSDKGISVCFVAQGTREISLVTVTGKIAATATLKGHADGVLLPRPAAGLYLLSVRDNQGCRVVKSVLVR